jgi:hypothetical protein
MKKGANWLNMVGAIQRVLKRHPLAGQHPTTPAEVGSRFQQADRAAMPVSRRNGGPHPNGGHNPPEQRPASSR